MADNVTYLNLDKMCASAKKTAFGTIMNTFIGGLVADTAYSGDLLSTAEVALLDSMCKGSSRGGGLGTVFNALLTASKNSEHITAITNTQATTLNKLCMAVTRVGDTISEVAYNGIGSVLQWAGAKVDSMAIDVGNHILTFSLPDQVGTSVIDHTAGTITAVCANIRTNLKAIFTLSLDATAKVGGVTQVSGVTENDFSSPVTYIVTAEDGTPKEYIVTVSLAEAVGTPIIAEENLTNLYVNVGDDTIATLESLASATTDMEDSPFFALDRNSDNEDCFVSVYKYTSIEPTYVGDDWMFIYVYPDISVPDTPRYTVLYATAIHNFTEAGWDITSTGWQNLEADGSITGFYPSTTQTSEAFDSNIASYGGKTIFDSIFSSTAF